MLYSNQLTNYKRDLSDAFVALKESAPLLVRLVGEGPEAVNTKHEWLDLQYSPVETTCSAISATNTTITVASTTGFSAGDVIGFKTSAGRSYPELMKISTVLTTTTLSVSRSFGAATAAAVAASSIVYLRFHPHLQGSAATDDSWTQHTANYNYTQIIARTAKVSGTSRSVAAYGINDALSFAVAQQLEYCMRELNNAMIFGERVAPTSTAAGVMGGLLAFIDSSSGNQVSMSSTTSLTSAKINECLEKIIVAGGSPNTLLTGTKTGRKISSFNASSVRTVAQDTKTGGYINQFIGDLGYMANIGIQNVVVDPNFPNEKILALDMGQIKLIPLKNRRWASFDATLPGSDYFAERVLGEYTIEVRNPLTAHGIIKGFELDY